MAEDQQEDKGTAAAPESKPAEEAKAAPKKEAKAAKPAAKAEQEVPSDFRLPAQVEHEDPWGDLPAQWRHYDDGTPAVQ